MNYFGVEGLGGKVVLTLGSFMGSYKMLLTARVLTVQNELLSRSTSRRPLAAEATEVFHTVKRFCG